VFLFTTKKKIIFLAVLTSLLIGGGVFYWWNNQKDVRELNKTLPKGVSVVKSLFGNEYKVVNKIDGYEFKVPKEWNGISSIEYIPKRTEGGYTASSESLKGKEGNSRIITIDRFEVADQNEELMSWVKTNFNAFGLVGNFTQDKVGEFQVVKTKESVHLLGMFVYFFKSGFNIYAITNSSEDFIHYIILNGKW